MTYSPVVPFGGLAGWQFLQRTRSAQMKAFVASGSTTRNTDYFRENISKIQSVGQLMDDRKLLTVALGAFGLEEDINNRAFIREVLMSKTNGERSLASRLSDKRYLELAKTFGFGDVSPPNTVLSDFGAKIVERYNTQAFEVAIGGIDPNLRLAASLEREIGAVVAKGASEKANWFHVLGNPALREVFLGAMQLPKSIASMDIDRQAEVMMEKATRIFGSSELSEFTESDQREKLTRLFLLRADLSPSSNAVSGGSVALAILAG